MKRFHVHVSVEDLDASIRFYATVFGGPPTVRKPDYAKWMLEDPRLNFAISKRGAPLGLDHLGFQVDSDDELQDLRAQVEQAEIEAQDQNGRVIPAVTYMAQGKEIDGKPSLRYITLIREGARAHGLPENYIRFLEAVEHVQ